MVESEVGYIKSTAFLNLTDSLTKSLGKTAAQEFLDRLEDDKWVVQVSAQISLYGMCVCVYSLQPTNCTLEAW